MTDFDLALALGDIDEKLLERDEPKKRSAAKWIFPAAAAFLTAAAVFAALLLIGPKSSEASPLGPEEQERILLEQDLLTPAKLQEGTVFPSPDPEGGWLIGTADVQYSSFAEMLDEADLVCICTLGSWLGEAPYGSVYYEATVNVILKGSASDNIAVCFLGSPRGQMRPPSASCGSRVLLLLTDIPEEGLSEYDARPELGGRDAFAAFSSAVFDVASDGKQVYLLTREYSRRGGNHAKAGGLTEHLYDHGLLRKLIEYLSVNEEDLPADGKMDGQVIFNHVFTLREFEEVYFGKG